MFTNCEVDALSTTCQPENDSVMSLVRNTHAKNRIDVLHTNKRSFYNLFIFFPNVAMILRKYF